MRSIGCAAFVAALLAASVCEAQFAPAPAPAASLQDSAKAIMSVFGQPLHPIVKSVGPGGGFGGGVGYTPKLRAGELWSARLEAVVTPNRYWNTQGSIEFTSERLHAEAYARAREMTRLDFFGLGQESRRDDRTSFRYDDRTIGGLASVPFRLSRTGMRVGGRIEGLFPDVGHGRNPDRPSIEQTFSEADAPGLTTQPTFAAYTGFVIAQYPDDLNQLSRLGTDLRASYTSFQDRDRGAFDFTRLTLEAQERLPGLRDSHKLTLHALFSSADSASGHRVPFYLLQTLGGNGDVRSFNDEILGTDASKATLRGFQDLRFRGSHLLLVQAEYRLKIRGPVDATVFVDGGSVGNRRDDLDLAHLKRDYGFSLSVMTIDATAIRVDAGFGGREGAHVFFSVGPIFQQ